MAKAATREVAVVDEALPAYLQGYEGPLGTEDIGKNDVKIPQILIGEAMADAVKDKIVEEGDLFLNVDMQTLAKRDEDLEVVLVAQSSEVLLWRDRNDQTGTDRVMAVAKKIEGPDGGFFHKWDKPNTEHSTKYKGVVPVTYKIGEIAEFDGTLDWGSAVPDDDDVRAPAATKHYNYVVYLPTKDLVATLSLARTRSAAAENLNTVLKMSKAPIWARSFKLRCVETTAKGSGDRWNTVKFIPNGFVSEDVAQYTRGLFDDFADKGFEVDRTGEEAASATEDDTV